MKRRLGLWFVCGFVFTFVLLAMTLTIYPMRPSVGGIVETKLWRFYLDELPRAFEVQTLGPTSSNQDALVMMLLQHAGLSAVGGAIAMAIVWWRRSR